jgi:hypothetical protein
MWLTVVRGGCGEAAVLASMTTERLNVSCKLMATDDLVEGFPQKFGSRCTLIYKTHL